MTQTAFQQHSVEISPNLFSSLMGEIRCIEEVLDALEEPSVGLEEVSNLVGGIQRDIAHLYRAAQE